jgi:hypothetical protein
MQTLWEFKTARFVVEFAIEIDESYIYDGDDENCEIQNALDSGEFVAFDSRVRVLLDGLEIGCDYLGGSVYAADDVANFYQDHRATDPMNRNCEEMRKARGNCSIGHYFPDMINNAISESRDHIANNPAPVMRQTEKA